MTCCILFMNIIFVSSLMIGVYEKIFITIMCVFCHLSAVSIHTRKGSLSLRNKVTGSLSATRHKYWDPTSDPQQEQQVLLTDKPSLPPKVTIFSYVCTHTIKQHLPWK